MPSHGWAGVSWSQAEPSRGNTSWNRWDKDGHILSQLPFSESVRVTADKGWYVVQQLNIEVISSYDVFYDVLPHICPFQICRFPIVSISEAFNFIWVPHLTIKWLQLSFFIFRVRLRLELFLILIVLHLRLRLPLLKLTNLMSSNEGFEFGYIYDQCWYLRGY